MKIYFLAILFCIATLAFAQETAPLHTKILKAQTLLQTSKAEKGIALLKKHFAKTKDPAAATTLVDYYFNNNQLGNALEWAKTANLQSSNQLKDVQLYAKMLISQGQIQQALTHCLNYASTTGDAKGVYDIAYACEAMIKANEQSVLYNVFPLEFNTKGDIVNVTNYRNQYAISSNAYSEHGKFDFLMLEPYYNKWREPYIMLKKPNKTNQTSISYTLNGNHLYFSEYALISEKEKKKLGELPPQFTIYSAINKGNVWVDVQKLSFQKEGFSYKDPAIHPKGEMLVFSANLEDKSQYDLYFTTKEGSVWSKPKKLTALNTESNEVKPYFKNDGSLYFASDNPLGFGGYDIYKTTLENDIWLKPDILPMPLNSEYDDVGIAFHYEQPGGFIISNRVGSKGGFDLYGFEDFNLTLSVSVVDQSSGTVLPNAEIKLIKGDNIVAQKRADKSGSASFNVTPNLKYTIIANKSGFESNSKAILEKQRSDGEIFYLNIPLKAAPKTKAAEKYANQDFIDFEAQFVNNNDAPIAHTSVKIVNQKTGRMKVVQTDKEGRIELSLYLGNKYKFLIEYDGDLHEKHFSTENMEASLQNVLFILNNNEGKSLID